MFKLTEAMVKKCCNQKTFERALEYIDSVSSLKVRGDRISVKVYGSMPRPYRVNICLNAKEWYRGACDCPAEFAPCKHVVATLLKYVFEGAKSVEPSFEEILKTLEADALRQMILEFVERKPELLDDPEEEFDEEYEEYDDY